MTSRKPTGLAPTEIASRLAPFWANPSDVQLHAIGKYIDLLLLWNHIVSLTAIEDPLEIVSRHFGESIFAGKIVPLQQGRLADVGTGAGFPGLALKIAFPELDVTLIDPNLKKCAFLAEVTGALGLKGVQIIRSQYEEVGPEAGKSQFICCRALGNYKSLLRWARNALLPGGSVILWLGLEDSLLIGRTEGWIWDPPDRIPESKRRLVLIGRPRIGT